MGVVVNNGIVMIEHINNLRRRGMARTQALVEGSRERLRPIMMTMGTAILAMVPISLTDMMQLTVDGMSCAHCVGRVTKAVQAIDQGATVAIDLATKRVTIDSTAPVQVLADAIDEAGYPVLARS